MKIVKIKDCGICPHLKATCGHIGNKALYCQHIYNHSNTVSKCIVRGEREIIHSTTPYLNFCPLKKG